MLYAIDDARNDIDIFLHMDRTTEFHKETLYKSEKAGLYFTKRLNLKWSGDNQIKGELVRLKEDYGIGIYDYYHLISRHFAFVLYTRNFLLDKDIFFDERGD